MLKKFGIAALALIMSIGAFSFSEAAVNDDYNSLCCNGNYCYSQNNQNNKSNRNDGYCGGYCSGNDSGCW